MADPDVPVFAQLIRDHYLFKGFDDAQIAHVVARIVRFDVKNGDVIYKEGDQGMHFYLILSGRVRVTQMEGLRERQLDILGPGDYFGEDALLFERPREVTITAIENGVLLVLGRDDFVALLHEYPQIRMNLSATAESRHLASREALDWLGEDEVIYLIARKHVVFLLVALIVPAIIGLIAIPIFMFAIGAGTPFFYTIGIAAGTLFALAGIGLTIWNWIDWGNDLYIVSNQRVVWLERVVIFYYSRREAPLTQVLSVNLKRSWLGRILNYGDIEVRTFTGGIKMRRASDPQRFVEFVENFRVRAKHGLEEEDLRAIRTSLRERLAEDQKSVRMLAPQSEPKTTDSEKVKPGGFREYIDTFLQMRYERDGVVTYRKHWLVLLRRIWQPVLTGLVILGFGIYLIWVGAPGTGLPLGLLLGFVLMCVFLWWLYNYLDWSNDIYQLTPDAILDIERKPLGSEDKKTAPLDSILSIEHSRDGIIQLLFNFGNVIINVGQTKFIFRVVYNPDQVHQDVADYIEARRRKKEQTEAVNERKRLGNWFTSYHDQTSATAESDQEPDWDLFPG